MRDLNYEIWKYCNESWAFYDQREGRSTGDEFTDEIIADAVQKFGMPAHEIWAAFNRIEAEKSKRSASAKEEEENEKRIPRNPLKKSKRQLWSVITSVVIIGVALCFLLPQNGVVIPTVAPTGTVSASPAEIQIAPITPTLTPTFTMKPVGTPIPVPTLIRPSSADVQETIANVETFMKGLHGDNYSCYYMSDTDTMVITYSENYDDYYWYMIASEAKKEQSLAYCDALNKLCHRIAGSEKMAGTVNMYAYSSNGEVICKYIYHQGTIEYEVFDKNDNKAERDKAAAVTLAKQYIQSLLKTPSLAAFQDVHSMGVYEFDGDYYVSGYVDSQNSFGATIRSQFLVALTVDGSGEKYKATIKRYEFE